MGSKPSCRRGDLGEVVWGRIAHLLPEGGRRGGRWREHRQVVRSILWKLRTGAPWRDVPECYGPWQTCYDRFVRWRRDGTWDRLLAHVQGEAHAEGEVVWEVSVDSTTCRAHQHASGARGSLSQEDVKRGAASFRRSLGAQSRWPDQQGPPLLRRQGQTSVDHRDSRPMALEYTMVQCTRRNPGRSARWLTRASQDPP
jgi:transposase